METFEYSKARRKEIQRQKVKRVAVAVGAGIVGGVIGYVLNGEIAAAVLAPLCALFVHYHYG